MNKEKELAKDFGRFSTLEKLRLLDEQVPTYGKPSELADQQTKVKWQMSGVFDEYHTPKKEEELKENHGFNSEVEEIKQRIQYWKDFNTVMSDMNDYKLEAMVDELKQKLGFVNRETASVKVQKLIKELHEQSN